jgi:hypothetical protein
VAASYGQRSRSIIGLSGFWLQPEDLFLNPFLLQAPEERLGDFATPYLITCDALSTAKGIKGTSRAAHQYAGFPQVHTLSSRRNAIELGSGQQISSRIVGWSRFS